MSSPHQSLHAALLPWDTVWPTFAAIFTMAALHMALPQAMSAGPAWLQFGLQTILILTLLLLRHFHHAGLTHAFGYATLGVATVALLYALGVLLLMVAHKTVQANVLLRSAIILWINNLLLFACWYWRLDAGGPHQRYARNHHEHGAFLFPQMTMDKSARARLGVGDWHPHFVDYLFLSFTTSTAFSPTDVPVLSRWGKALMMIQSLIALTILAVLAARAINIL